jgi:DNA-binding PadR family transcriptional regulator
MKQHEHEHHDHHEAHEHPHDHGRGWGGRRGPRGGPWGDFVDPRLAQRMWGGGRRRRRGDVRGDVLSALLEGPAHGYEVIRRLEERSGGYWRPSPGSVYPTLQLLEDAGLVRATEQDGRRTYELTDEGRTEAEQRAASGAPSGPGEDPELDGALGLRDSVGQLFMAARQVASAGNPDQIERATAAIRQSRQALYRILAEE